MGRSESRVRQESNIWLLACYAGKKSTFSNYNLFAVDGAATPIVRPLYGVDYQEVGPVLQYSYKGGRTDRKDIDVRGWHNKLGACGMCSLGNGYFYLASSEKSEQGHSATLHLARYRAGRNTAFEILK